MSGFAAVAGVFADATPTPTPSGSAPSGGGGAAGASTLLDAGQFGVIVIGLGLVVLLVAFAVVRQR